MNSERQPTRNDHPNNAKDADDSSIRTIPGSQGPSKYDLLAQFVESIPIQGSDVRNMARFAPLVSAVLAPISTLLDIPALTQHWFYNDGVAVQDPRACVALSAVGLAFNVVGNVLLVLRFSSPHRRSKAVSLSLYAWIAKTIIAIVNIAYFGAWRNKNPEFTFDEGFWAGVVSVIIAGIISICLLLHYVFAYMHDNADSTKLQITGRKFMLSITTLFVLIGFQALAFSRLEGWKYFDGIYFSTQTTLTVGYGDLVPTTTWSKILCFPFAVLTIAQLANQVSIIIDFIKDRATTRRDHWRKRYSIAMHRAALEVKPYGTLIDEICLIHQIELHQQSLLQLYDLIWSFSGLIVFYVVGAACFNAMESWGYGNAVYAVVILSTSIGLGDYTPETPGGRVFWVIYALMCVPIITSFATNTVTGIMYTISEHKYQQSGFRMARDEDPEAFAPHSHFILKNHEKWDGAREKYNTHIAMRRKALSQGVELTRQQERLITCLLEDPSTHAVVVEALGGVDKASLEQCRDCPDAFEDSGEETRVAESPPPKRVSEEGSGDSPHEVKAPSSPNVNPKPSLKCNTLLRQSSNGHTVFGDLARDMPGAGIEFKLCKALIDRVTHLEAQSRQMLIDTMDENLARTVLLADRNLQVRDALHLYDFGIDLQGNYRAEAEEAWREAVAKHGLGDASAADQEDMLARVRRYRDTFAEILVLGSTMLQLQGDDLKRFERWRTGDMHHAAKVGKAVKGTAVKGAMKHRRKKLGRRRSQAAQSVSEILSESESCIERELCPSSDRESNRSRWRRSRQHSAPSRPPSKASVHIEESHESYSLRPPSANEAHGDETRQPDKQHISGFFGLPEHLDVKTEHKQHVDPCGAADVPSSPPALSSPPAPSIRATSTSPTSTKLSPPQPHRRTSAPISPNNTMGVIFAPFTQPRSPFSAHPASAPKHQWDKHTAGEKRFVDVMARSVLKAADREANQAREGWMDWLADKAYDVVSDAGHRVHVRHHRSESGRMGWTMTEHGTRDSGSETDGSRRRSRRWSRRLSKASSRREEEGLAGEDDNGPVMRGGGEREGGGGGGSAAWVGGAGEGGGEESARVRAKEKGKRRQEQEARRNRRRRAQARPSSSPDSSSSDGERLTDGEGRQRMTLHEHVTDFVHEAKERHAERKEQKAGQAEMFAAVRAPDPSSVPLPESVEPVAPVETVVRK